MVESKQPNDWLLTAETVEFLVTCLNGAGSTFLATRPNPGRDSSRKAIRAWAETIIKECEKQGLIKSTWERSGGRSDFD